AEGLQPHVEYLDPLAALREQAFEAVGEAVAERHLVALRERIPDQQHAGDAVRRFERPVGIVEAEVVVADGIGELGIGLVFIEERGARQDFDWRAVQYQTQIVAPRAGGRRTAAQDAVERELRAWILE